MDTVGKRVRAAREKIGWSQDRLAKEIGIKQPSVFALENTPAAGSKHLLKIAQKTGVRPEWLESGEEPMVNSVEPARTLAKGSVKEVPKPLQLPIVRNLTEAFDGPLGVKGMAECGPDGWAPFNGETVQYIPRPANLIGVPDAYAVFIAGTSMEPKFSPGDIAHIHPYKPPTPGCYVLVQKQPNGPGETPLAVIKRLVRRSGEKVVLEQSNPPKTITIRADEIKSIHRVVGSSES